MKHGDEQALLNVVNSVRRYLQTHTCCVDTGAEAAVMVLASLMLDKCDRDPAAAAATLEQFAATMARNLRSGQLTVQRTQ